MRKLTLVALLASTCLIAPAKAQSVLMLVTPPPPAACSSAPLPIGSNTVAAAYGLRVLVQNWTGNIIQLKRASDGTTQNIGPAVNGCDLNTTTAATFCAATTCTIQTFYEQSGSGATNATQATVADQATYTASCVNSLPCGTYAVPANAPSYNATLASGVTAVTLYWVAEFTSFPGAGNGYVVSISAGSGQPVTWTGYRTPSSGCVALRNNGGGAEIGSESCTTGSWYVTAASMENALSHILVNGTAGTDNTTSQSLSSQTALSIGEIYQSSNAGTNGLYGNLTDVIVFAPDISDTNAKTVCLNSANYYNIAAAKSGC
jgi:hypothetical protein